MPLNIRQEGPVRIAPVSVQKAGEPATAVRATALELPGPSRPPKAKREDPTLASLANPRRVVNEMPMPVVARIEPPPVSFGRARGEAHGAAQDGASDGDESGSFTDETGSDETGSDASDEGPDQPFESQAARAERIRAEKTELLNRLYDYARKGEVVPEHLGLRSTVDELREAVERIKHSVAKRASVKFQGRMLVTVVTGLELLNSNLDVVGPDLDGWSHTVMTEVTDYETAFEQLYELYGKQFDCHPLITIMLMLGLSGWNHMSFAKKRRDDGEAGRPSQATAPAPGPVPRPQQPQASPAVPANRISAAVQPAATQAGPGQDRREPERPPQPSQPFNAAAGAAAPPSAPYVMKGPAGLGVLPGFSPLGLAHSGTPTAPAQFPPSQDLLLRTAEVTVPPRQPEPTATVVEITEPAKPKRGRPRRNGEDAASEAGVTI